MLPGIVRDFYFRPNKKHSRQRAGLYAGGQCSSVQPGLLKPNRITKAEVTFIDAAKQVKPDMLLGYALKMKDAFRLAHLHKTQCYLQCFSVTQKMLALSVDAPLILSLQ